MCVSGKPRRCSTRRNAKTSATVLRSLSHRYGSSRKQGDHCRCVLYQETLHQDWGTSFIQCHCNVIYLKFSGISKIHLTISFGFNLARRQVSIRYSNTLPKSSGYSRRDERAWSCRVQRLYSRGRAQVPVSRFQQFL